MSTDPSLFSTLMNIFAGVYSDATPIAYAVCIIWIGQRLLRRTYSFFPKHSLPATILYFLVLPVIILSSVAYSSGHKVRKAPLTSFPTVEVEGQDFNGTSKATLYLIRNLSDGVKWSCFLGQVCGLAKMHLVSVHATFRVSLWSKYAASGVRLSRAV